MPRRRKTAEAPAAGSRGTRSDAVRAALEAHPDKMPKEIAELLQAEGLDVKAHDPMHPFNDIRNIRLSRRECLKRSAAGAAAR